MGQGELGHDDVIGKVLIDRTQSVIGPSAEGRVTAEPTTRVHVKEGFRVVERLGEATAVIAQLIGDLGEVDPMIAHVQSGFSYLARTVWAANEKLVSLLQGAGSLAFFLVQGVELGFGVEGVDLAGPPSMKSMMTLFALGSCIGFFTPLEAADSWAIKSVMARAPREEVSP